MQVVGYVKFTWSYCRTCVVFRSNVPAGELGNIVFFLTVFACFEEAVSSLGWHLRCGPFLLLIGFCSLNFMYISQFFFYFSFLFFRY